MSEETNGLEEIKRRLSEIDRKLDRLLMLRSQPQMFAQRLVPKTLAALPEHLRKTASTIAAMGRATAREVAAKTGRTRAAESDYLNQLASRGFLKKEKRGREVDFLVFALHTACPQCGSRVAMTLDRCPMCGAALSKEQ
jgi:predicted transcriptional regulator